MTEPVPDVPEDDRDDALDERDDDPVMQSMRSVWLSMREEDPPQGGLAELMAAARTKAAQMQPKESWWQRVVATLRRPPVLALATVVLLVGGAVLIGRRQSDMKVEETAPSATPTSSPVDRGADKQAGEPALQGTAPVTPPASEPTVDVPASPAIASGSATADPHAAGPRRVRKSRPPRDLDKADAAEDDTKAKESTLDEASKNTGPDPALATDDAGESAADKTVTSPVQPGGASGQATAKPPPRPITSAQLVEQSAAAAARGDCATVKVMSERLRKLNLAVYNEQIAKNPAIAKCLK